MDLSNRLVNLAKRSLPVSREFDELIRGIGECKSKGEEDIIVARIVEITRQKLKERSSRDTRTLKEVLVYLMYMEMLGHETGWAQAAVIQLCSEKNLAVKKMAYLATSLLVEPASELSILVTATIQADLKSDNFLVVCTALQAICHIASSELVDVFLPQVTALLKHDRDLVKKKSLLVLQRFTQLDRGIAQDVEKLLVEKIGYKEPSVMVASLCGLHDLIRQDPSLYRNLAHYFTNILKQAAEGKLGRAYEYHRAPAPFVQMELLRLLAMLGAGDKHTSENIYATVAEVKRRAEPLGNNIGNAVVYECLKTVATIHPSPILIQQSLDTIARFLAARENNLKYAGIDILSRLVRLDSKYAQDHQYAVVDCLRSPDVTLKKKTLELLYKMAGPTNIEVIAQEVIGYIKESGDELARREAVTALSDLAERFAPDHQWFVDTINELFEVAGDLIPSKVADNLMRLIAEGTGEDGDEGDTELRSSAAMSYLDLLDRPKLPAVLLKVICWVLGEYGTLSGQSAENIMDKLAAIPDTQSATDEVKGMLLLALGKLSTQSGCKLTADAQALLDAATASSNVELQQRALEVQALLRSSQVTQQAALPFDASCEDIDADPKLSFLEAFVQQALRNGAAPYLSAKDRVAIGMARSSSGNLPASHTQPQAAHGAGLKFQAYEKAALPVPRPLAGTDPFAASSAAAGDLSALAGLNLGPQAQTTYSPESANAVPTASVSGIPASAAAGPAPAQAPGPQLVINKPRKWGAPQFEPPPAAPVGSTAATPPSPGAVQAAYPTAAAAPHSYPSPTHASSAAPPADAEKQRLAASLFGVGASGASPARARRSAAATARATAPSPSSRPRPQEAQPSLLGDVSAPPTSSTAEASGGLDMLLDVGTADVSQLSPALTVAAPPVDPLAALSGLNVDVGATAPTSAGLGDLLGVLGGVGGGMSQPVAGVIPGMGLPAATGFVQQQEQQQYMGGMMMQPPATKQATPQAGSQQGMGGAPLRMGQPVQQQPRKKDPFADLLG